MFNYFVKKKYVTPFLENLKSQKKIGNTVFYYDYKPDKSYIVLLCYGTKIIEINELDSLIIFDYNEKNYTKWDNYKNKIILLKNEGKTFTSQTLILNVSESIRHLSNQLNMNFKQTQNILNNLLFSNLDYYEENPPIIVESNSLNKWID